MEKFVKVKDRTELKRKSGIYRITNKETKESFIGISKELYQCINGNIFSPSQWKRRPDFKLFKDLQENGEKKFTIEICNVGADWEELKNDRGILISELKPAYNYSSYDHRREVIVDVPEVEPLKDDEKENICKAFASIKTYLSENKPDFKEMFRALVLVLMYPQVTSLNGLTIAAGGDFITNNGECMISNGPGKQQLNFSKYAKWLLKGESKSAYNGMGNLDFLKNMVLVLNFRPAIEKELSQEFQTLIDDLKEIYKKHYDQDFAYDTNQQNTLTNKNKGLFSAQPWCIVCEMKGSQPYYRLDNAPNRAKASNKREYQVIY